MRELIEFMTARLQEDRAYLDAATPGRWETHRSDGDLAIRADQSPPHRPKTLHRYVLEGQDYLDAADAEHIARWGPQRARAVLTAMEAHVAQLATVHRKLDDAEAQPEHYGPARRGEILGLYVAALAAVRSDASLYAHHPAYQSEWSPHA